MDFTCIHRVKNVKKIIFSFCFTFSCFYTSTALSSDNSQGLYLSMSLGYYNSAVSGNTNIIKLSQPPNSLILKAENQKSPATPTIDFEVGRRWLITSHLFWSLGTHFGYMSIDQKGNSNVAEEGLYNNYSYLIDSYILSLSGRLIYSYNTYDYFVELNPGVAILASNNYGLTTSNLTATYSSKTVINPSYAAFLGLSKHINKRNNIGFSIGYIDMGTAELGSRLIKCSGGSVDNIKQKLSGFIAKINFSYMF